MKVVMPIAKVYPEAIAAFVGSCFSASQRHPLIVDVSGDDFAYWRLLSSLRNEGGFVVVEHDIVVRSDTIYDLLTCPEPWCGYAYLEAPGDPVTGLGCTKLDGRVMESIPWQSLDPVAWGNVDYQLISTVRDRLFYTEHRHEPPLRHLNPRVAGL